MTDPMLISTTDPIQEALSALATLEGTITNLNGVKVKWAYPYAQWQTPTSVLPFFVNIPQSGPIDIMAAGGLQKVDLAVDCLLCLQPLQMGKSLAGVLEYVYTWPYSVIRAFTEHIRLGGDLPYVIEAPPTEWQYVSFQYGDVMYHALRFRINMRMQFQFTVGG